MKPLDVVEPRTPISSVPFVIGQSGSYYLTRNLEATGAGDGIRVYGSAISVTIDLNGFSVIGAGTPFTSGIVVNAGAKVVSVRNGTVRDWDVGIGSDYGVTMKLSHVTVEANTYRGVQLLGGGEVENSAVIGNLKIGIIAGANTTIRESRVIGNLYNGIVLFDGGSTVESTFVSGNGYLASQENITLSRSGIWAESGVNRIVDCLVQNNSGDGIYMADSNYVAGNHLIQNGLAGISVSGTGNRIEGNYVVRNFGNGIFVGGTGNIFMRNTAAGNVAGNYSIGAGNIAPIETTSVTNLVSNIQY
jgi:parallel beta-helix repeat protein